MILTVKSFSNNDFVCILHIDWIAQFAWTVCLYFAHSLNHAICVICMKILYVFCAVIARNFSVG